MDKQSMSSCYKGESGLLAASECADAQHACTATCVQGTLIIVILRAHNDTGATHGRLLGGYACSALESMHHHKMTRAQIARLHQTHPCCGRHRIHSPAPPPHAPHTHAE